MKKWKFTRGDIGAGLAVAGIAITEISDYWLAEDLSKIGVIAGIGILIFGVVLAVISGD